MKFTAIVGFVGITNAVNLNEESKHVGEWFLHDPDRVDPSMRKVYHDTKIWHASQTKAVWNLTSLQDHREDAAVQEGYATYSTERADGRPPYQSAVQLE